MNLIALKMRQKRPLTESELHDACRLAQRGNVNAQKLITKLVKSNDRARAIILEFFFDPKKYRKGGMPKGHVTEKGAWMQTIMEELEDFIEQEKAKGLGKKEAEYEGAKALCADYADEELAPFLEGLTFTPEKLLNAWKRGKRRRKDAP
jgi:hypothetical protein